MKRFTALLTAILLMMPAPAIFADAGENEPIYIKGDFIISEDFEDEAAISEGFKPDNDLLVYSELDGRKGVIVSGLKPDGSGRVAWSTPVDLKEYKYLSIETDVKQIDCNASSSGAFAIGARANGQKESYMMSYLALAKINDDGHTVGNGSVKKDRLALGRSTNGYFDSWYYSAFSDRELGIMDQKNKNTFYDFQRMSFTLLPDRVSGGIYGIGADGETETAVEEMSASYEELDKNKAGSPLQQLETGNLIMYVQVSQMFMDSIRIREIYAGTDIGIKFESDVLPTGQEISFCGILTAADGTATEVPASYFDFTYDEEALTLDKNTGTAVFKKEGEFPVHISAKGDYGSADKEKEVVLTVSDDGAKVAETEAVLDIEGKDNITASFEVPILSENGCTIHWSLPEESPYARVEGNNVLITRPLENESDVQVTLKAVIEKGSVQREKIITLTILKEPLSAVAVAEDAKWLAEYNILDGTTVTLPERGPNGSKIVWQSDNPDIISSTGGKVNRPRYDTTVSLSYTISKNDVKPVTGIKKLPVSGYDGTKPSSSGGGGGGSSGSGGSRTNSVKVNGMVEVTPPTPIPSEQNSEENQFQDMEGFAWAQEAVSALAEAGIIAGVSGAEFAPGREIKREEFIKMAVCAFGMENANADSPFEDVKQTDWFYPYVSAAYEKGITYGQGTRFGTGGSITRQDMAVFICRLLELEGTVVPLAETEFADNGEIAAYAKASVAYLSGRGILSGVGENRFAPREPATRAETAKVLYEVLNLTENN